MKMMMNLQMGGGNKGARVTKDNIANNTTGKKRRKCNNCGKMGFHEDGDASLLQRTRANTVVLPGIGNAGATQ